MRVAVASAADSAYALPLAVMLQSAATNLDPSWQLAAYLVVDGIAKALREKIVASLPARVSLHWIERPRGEFAGLPVWGRMTLATYHKLTLGEWLPNELQKVIWLDADTLVLGDLARLWETNLGNQTALAVQDVIVPHVSSRFGVTAYRELGLAPQAKYFNAGVMPINLARWRREAVAAHARKYLQRYYARVCFWDQESLNAVLAGQWKTLDPRWNWNPVRDRLARDKSAQSDPWIIHFSGNLKPWNYRGTDSHHLRYYHWLDRTAWKGWRPAASWRGRAIAAYESSHLRRLLYPLEQIYLRLVRMLTRR